MERKNWFWYMQSSQKPHIPDKCKIFYNKEDEIQNGDFVVVANGLTLFVARYHRMMGVIVLSFADGSNSLIINGENADWYAIAGRVTSYTKDFDRGED